MQPQLPARDQGPHGRRPREADQGHQGGDKVRATDPETGQSQSRTVEKLITTKHDKDFATITIRDTDGGKPSKIVATVTHPFWVESEGAWVDAGHLKAGMRLLAASGLAVAISSVKIWHEEHLTHDLTVSVTHTYYVVAGEVPLLVHNCGSGENGGKYGDLQPAGTGNEINHIPANSVSPLSTYSGPSIRMEYADHRAVYSTGSYLESQAWRMRQKELIDAGDFRGAIQMDVDDIRARFGNKYDEAITEMWVSLSSNKALRKWASEQGW